MIIWIKFQTSDYWYRCFKSSDVNGYLVTVIVYCM